LRASASLHGTTLITEKPDSAHVGVNNFQGEVYCGFAETDEYAPLPMVQQWNRLMAASPARYTSVIHKGAEHGYALPDRDLFHKQGAERDWELIFAMFHRQIPPGYAR
jgi:carboxymethylenebutenolidase